jgi:protein SCO1/2
MKYLCIILVLVFTSCKKEVKKENIKVVENSRVDYLPYYNDESFTPQWLTPNAEAKNSFHRIPNFSLTNQLGETVNQKTFENKIYITDFFFASCPGICPKMTANMSVLQEEFKDDNDILFLSHTVTPTTDSVSVLKSYAERNGVIDHKWHLVTGNKTEIYDLGRKAYFVENDLGIPKNIEDFLHTENFLLIDKKKHIRGIYNGLKRASMAQLIVDIKTLKLE